MIEDILVPLSFFVATAFVLGKRLDTRHKERMALIDRGVTAAEMQGAMAEMKQPVAKFTRELTAPNPSRSLKWGLLLIFAGAGLLTGRFLDLYYQLTDDVLQPACTLIGGGIGLTLFYFITRMKPTRSQAAAEV